jgi:hypothetical protein
VETGQKTRPIVSTRYFFKRMQSILGRAAAIGEATEIQNFKVEGARGTRRPPPPSTKRS